MPLPFIAGAVAAKVAVGALATTGVVGVAKGVKGGLDNKEANDVQKNAEGILNRAKNKIEQQKKQTTNSIKQLGTTKLTICSNEIRQFVNDYSKIKGIELKDSEGISELGKLSFGNDVLVEMKDTSISALSIMSGGASSVGTGILLGWGTYGGVMALGTASTGTAIGTLSGVAATNATLAWLGGGAIAAGGGGMALGTVVLGGLVAGPALLVAGGLYGAKAKEKLHNAYTNLAEAKKIAQELELAGTELKNISIRTNQFDTLLNQLNRGFKNSLQGLHSIVSQKTKWKEYSDEEKNTVFIAVKYAQIIKTIIDIPMLDETGKLTLRSEQILKDSEILALKNTINSTSVINTGIDVSEITAVKRAILEEVSNNSVITEVFGEVIIPKYVGWTRYLPINHDYIHTELKADVLNAGSDQMTCALVKTGEGEALRVAVMINSKDKKVIYYSVNTTEEIVFDKALNLF